MNARNQHPAMYNETNGSCFERNAYDNVKFDFKTNCLYQNSDKKTIIK